MSGVLMEVNFNIPPEFDDDFPTDALDEPLRLAPKHDHHDATRLLLEHGANPNTHYFFGSEINLVNPLNTQLLHLHLSYRANPNAHDRQGFTPIMKCCRLQQDTSDEMETREIISGVEVLKHFAQTLMSCGVVQETEEPSLFCLIDLQANFDCDTVEELRKHQKIPDPVTYINTHTQNSPNSNIPPSTSEEEELLNLDTRELVNIIQSL
ncbi:hypothetical protein Pcinc_021151 [Petrolisthes cinctipes]|uniref:Uncharacterized protein n=1 Tax=Petrolisthes cinctipes TaxID=88211 RepID=A0AAE1FI53_PETCI|nr:hypothetical protein Pcinc_021151 [Petrolisthes cinctipes]